MRPTAVFCGIFWMPPGFERTEIYDQMKKPVETALCRLYRFFCAFQEGKRRFAHSEYLGVMPLSSSS